MTREELNNLKEGDTVKAPAFPYADRDKRGELMDWEVVKVYPAALENPHHFGRVLITRQGHTKKHMEFVTHNAVHLVSLVTTQPHR